MSNFSELYEPGEVLSLQDSDGREIAQAGVIEYDILDPDDTLTPHNWHVAVQEPGGAVLPAAIWEDDNGNGVFDPHLTYEQELAEAYGAVRLYPSDQLLYRVGIIAAQVSKIVPLEVA